MNVWRTLPSTGGVHFNSTYRTAVPSVTSVTARAPLVPERLASTRRSKNDNTPRPLDQWTNSPFIGQRVGNCKCFTLTHYLADLFAMHRGPRSIPLCIQHHIQLTSLSFQVIGLAGQNDGAWSTSHVCHERTRPRSCPKIRPHPGWPRPDRNCARESGNGLLAGQNF